MGAFTHDVICMREFVQVSDGSGIDLVRQSKSGCTIVSTSFRCSTLIFSMLKQSLLLSFSVNTPILRGRHGCIHDHERALDCYYLVAKEVLLNVCLHFKMEEIDFLRKFAFLFSFLG